MNHIKSILVAFILIILAHSTLSAQYFTATLDHMDNYLIVKIRPNPTGGDIDLALGQFEVFIRKLDTEPSFSFNDLTPNLVDFPGLTTLSYVGENSQGGSDTGYTNYHFSYNIGAAVPSSFTYTDGQEYEVFRVEVQGDPVDMADFQISANATTFITYLNIQSNIADFTDPGSTDFFYGTTGSAAGTGGGTTFFEAELNVTLPIVLNVFEAQRKDKSHALVTWETTNEINASHFEIQRSESVTNWRTLATVKSQAINAKGSTYEYLDLNAINHKNEDDKLYYRLNMIDLDGSSEYTETKSVLFDVIDFNAQVYPSPARINDQLTITFEAQSVDPQLIYIVSPQGKVVKQLTTATTSIGELVELKVNLEQSLASGNYMILYGPERVLIDQFTVLK